MARIRGKSTTKTFAYMWIGARHMVKLAKSSPDGRLYTCVSALVLSAFMLEAYLNHLGSLRHADWKETERKLSKTKKFLRFAADAGLNPSMDERPFRSLVQLFAFRDSMAHGRTVTEEIDVEVELKESLARSLPGAEWQRFATVSNAEELLGDATRLIRDLHRAMGYKDDPFASGGGGMYAVTLPEA